MLKVILAGNNDQAMHYVRAHGWRDSEYIIVQDRAQALGLCAIEVHRVGSYADRQDLDAIEGALKLVDDTASGRVLALLEELIAHGEFLGQQLALLEQRFFAIAPKQ